MAFTITFKAFPMEGPAFMEYLHNTFGVKPEELELAEASAAPNRIGKTNTAKLDQDLVAAISDGHATMGAIKKALTGWAGINTSQVRRRLASLESEGAITHSGLKRGTRYAIVS